MKYYIRRTNGQGRVADCLSRAYTNPKKAKAELKDWLREANPKRKAAGLEPYRVNEDFKIVQIERHPYVSAGR